MAEFRTRFSSSKLIVFQVPLICGSPALFTVPVSMLPGTAILIDRNPFSETLSARVHGRVDMVLSGVSITLSILFNLHARVSPTALVVVVCLAGLLRLYSYTWCTCHTTT